MCCAYQKDESKRVEDTKAAVHGEAESRRARKRAAQSRKGQTYRIGPEVPRQQPVEFYPEGYDPETMTVIGWNTHEYLEIEGPKVSVRVEREAICKLKDAKPTDAHTQIFEAKGSQNCLPGCIAGNSTMATIITDKYCHHLPEYRQVKRFEAMGLKLSTTSIRSTFGRFALQRTAGSTTWQTGCIPYTSSRWSWCSRRSASILTRPPSR